MESDIVARVGDPVWAGHPGERILKEKKMSVPASVMSAVSALNTVLQALNARALTVSMTLGVDDPRTAFARLEDLRNVLGTLPDYPVSDLGTVTLTAVGHGPLGAEVGAVMGLARRKGIYAQ